MSFEFSRMSWFWTIIFLTFALTKSSEANHHHQKTSAVIVGTVYCDTCFQQTSPKSSHFIAGASVAVECKDTSSTPRFRQEVKTDSHGEFKVHLPFPVSKHVKKIKGCSVKLISSNRPYCAVAAAATSSNLHLKSRKEGAHIFSAGFFTFRPLICDQKPSINNFKKQMNDDEKLSQISNPKDPTFLPPIQDPPSDPPAFGGFLPPLPRLPPLPLLPRLPPLPSLPFLPPIPKNEGANKAPNFSNNAINKPNAFPFPPNPFNPPVVFPPNPFQPPPSVIPPAFPSPSSPPFFNLPSFPGLTPSPSPPSSSFPISLPPFPFQPTPGVPPAEVSSPSKTSSP